MDQAGEAVKRSRHDFLRAFNSLPYDQDAQTKRLLRKLVRDTLLRDWEIHGAHQGEPERAHMNRIAKELVP